MRNSSSLDWLRFMHTPNDYRVSRNSPFIIKSIQFCVHLSLGICSPLGKFLYTRIFSTFFGHPVQLVYCMQNESPGMSFMRDLLS